MTALVLRADARRLPLADASVDLVVTSPPYFALRSYTDGGEHYDGQVGAEDSPAEFIDALLAVTAECARVLKPTGSIWVNLGDKYGRSQTSNVLQTKNKRTAFPMPTAVAAYGTPKSLMGLPWRYALACMDQLGLILRAEVIWAKPNGMPESVTDRVRGDHEPWFHFTKQGRYFAAIDELREPHSTAPLYPKRAGGRVVPGMPAQTNFGAGGSHLTEANYNPLGKLPGSVWTVATTPLVVPEHLGVDHFAAFPPELPKRIIQGWSPAGICIACGDGRRPVTDARPAEPYPFAAAQQNDPGRRWNNSDPTKRTLGTPAAERERTITGYACTCAEPSADTRPAIVLDCFGGSGTTAMVAHALGRVGVSVDLSADYCRLAQWRTQDLAQIAKVRDEPFRKPAVQVDGQEDLFGGAA